MRFKEGEKVRARYVVPLKIENGEVIHVLGPHNGETGTVTMALGNLYRVRFAGLKDAFLRATDLEKIEEVKERCA